MIVRILMLYAACVVMIAACGDTRNAEAPRSRGDCCAGGARAR